MSEEVIKLDVEKRKQLLDMRDKLNNFMAGDGIPFSGVKMVITRYLLLLFKLHPAEYYLDRKDEQKDFEILKGLQVKLDHEYAFAKDKYFVVQFAFVDAHRKRAMMLRQLSSLSQNDSGIKADLREWIKRQLLHDNWWESLRFANLMEKQLKEEAKENEVDVSFLIQRATSEPIEGKDLKSVQSQFKACQEELNAATKKSEENLYAYVHIPPMCESVERIVRFLKATCLFKNDDDIKVDEESQHHSSMQPEEGAKLLDRSQDAVQQPAKAEQSGLTSNRINRAPEESQDNCSEMDLSR